MRIEGRGTAMTSRSVTKKSQSPASLASRNGSQIPIHRATGDIASLAARCRRPGVMVGGEERVIAADRAADHAPGGAAVTAAAHAADAPGAPAADRAADAAADRAADHAADHAADSAADHA